MRISLTAAHFNIVRARGHVKFEDIPCKVKRSPSKISFRKRKSEKKTNSDNIDPVLAELPESATLKKANTTEQQLPKKQMQRRKESGNITINLYTKVIQSYENYKSLWYKAQNLGVSGVEAWYGDCMDAMQEEILMANMVLAGLCSPD